MPQKRPKNIAIKPLSTIISVPCMKIQEGGPLRPAADAHAQDIHFRPSHLLFY